MNIFGFFECKFCEARFVNEKRFNKHKCDLKERYDTVKKTKRGRFAYTLYKTWISVRGYRKPTIDIFIESKYYGTMFKFAEFYYETMLPDYTDYIKFVTKKGYLPHMWGMAEVYQEYIVLFDDRVKPIKQAEITFKFIDILANSVDVGYGDIFEHLYVNEVIKLIQCRRLSPWVLLQSKRFMEYRTSLDDDECIALDSMLNLDVWIPRFTKYKRELKIIKGLVNEFGL